MREKPSSRRAEAVVSWLDMIFDRFHAGRNFFWLPISILLLFFSTGLMAPAAGVLPPIQTVFVIILENKSWSDLKGSADAPYINNTLLPMSSYCEQYNNVPGLHPSLPNYIWLEAGTNFGIVDDNDPYYDAVSVTNHLSTQLTAAGISWKAYQEHISTNSLPLTSNGSWSARHNPFLYFNDVTGTNNSTYPYGLAHIRPLSELGSDLTNNTVCRYNFIIGDDCHDMHSSCSPLYNLIRQGDNWLAQEVPMILSSPAYKNGGALFISCDEGHNSDPLIGMIVLSPFAKGGGYISTNYFTHSSMLRTMQEVFGVGPLLGDAANADDLADLFTQPGPRINGIFPQPDGTMRIDVASVAVGQRNILQRSLELTNWNAVGTNLVTATNTFSFFDLTATNLTQGYYRVLQVP